MYKRDVDADKRREGDRQGDRLVQDHPLLYGVLRRIGKALAETLGDSCEVVVHDLRDPKSSIVHIENGYVTSRQVGDGIHDMAMILRSERFADDMLANYLRRTEDGKLLKSMTVMIRNEAQEIVGAFAMNFDLGRLLNAKAIIDDFVKGHELEPTDGEQVLSDDNVVGILRHIIRKTIEEAGVPVSEMSREDKVRIVAFLDEKEVFLIKGAVNYVAQTLNVSRFTIYNYLEEIRSKRLGDQDADG